VGPIRVALLLMVLPMAITVPLIDSRGGNLRASPVHHRRSLLQTEAARRRRTSRGAQIDAQTGGDKIGVGWILLMVGAGVAMVAGAALCYVCRRRRRVGAGMTTMDSTQDGKIVQISGGGKAMYKADFEAKIGKMGFDEADGDSSGRLSKNEWIELFEKVDLNGDGIISEDEWNAAFGPGRFDSWDKDGNGRIDEAEWRKIYMSKKSAAATVAAAGGPKQKYHVTTTTTTTSTGSSVPVHNPFEKKKKRKSTRSEHLPSSQSDNNSGGGHGGGVGGGVGRHGSGAPRGVANSNISFSNP